MKSRKEKPVVDEAVEELVEELESFVEPAEDEVVEKPEEDILKDYVLFRATTNVNIRSEASIGGDVVGRIVGNELFAIDTVENGNWGKLADERGYVCLDYAKKEEN